jgi:hypothetical protein
MFSSCDESIWDYRQALSNQLVSIAKSGSAFSSMMSFKGPSGHEVSSTSRMLLRYCLMRCWFHSPAIRRLDARIVVVGTTCTMVIVDDELVFGWRVMVVCLQTLGI